MFKSISVDCPYKCSWRICSQDPGYTMCGTEMMITAQFGYQQQSKPQSISFILTSHEIGTHLFLCSSLKQSIKNGVALIIQTISERICSSLVQAYLTVGQALMAAVSFSRELNWKQRQQFGFKSMWYSKRREREVLARDCHQ